MKSDRGVLREQNVPTTQVPEEPVNSLKIRASETSGDRGWGGKLGMGSSGESLSEEQLYPIAYIVRPPPPPHKIRSLFFGGGRAEISRLSDSRPRGGGIKEPELGHQDSEDQQPGQKKVKDLSLEKMTHPV